MRAVFILILLLGVVAPAPAKPTGGVAPTAPHIDAVIGRPLVVPVSLAPGRDPGEPLRARLEDGRFVDATLVWIERTGAEAPGWLVSGGEWRARTPDQDRAPGGFWSVVLLLPRDAIGQGVWIDRALFELHWLDDPEGLLHDVAEQSRSAERPWTHPIDEERLASPTLRELAEPCRLDPTRRWRYRLLYDGLEPPNEPYFPGLEGLTEAPGSFGDPVVEALARQTETRWRIALARLWLDDPVLADDLKRSLVATADFGDGVVVPAWASDGVERLLDDLLTAPDERRRTALARNFLDAQPHATAWVCDDRSRTDGRTGKPVASVGVANLAPIATLAWGSAGSPTPELSPLSGGSAVVLSAIIDGSDSAIANAGEVGFTLPLFARPIPASPPGALAAPFRHDWTMGTWLDANERRGSLPPPGWETGVLVTHDDEGRWVALIECAAPEDADTTGESVRLWFGPYGSPSAVLRVTPDGVVAERGVPGDAEPQTHVEPGRWLARVLLPPGAVAGDGTLLLGVTRTDALGRRWGWPRRVLPWLDEPGRGAIDCSAWDREP